MLRMEVHNVASTFLFFKGFSPPSQGEYSLNEIVSELRVMKPSLVLRREEREMFHKYPGEHSHSLFNRHPLFIIDLDPLHTAAWGITFKNKSTKIFFFQIDDTFPGPLDPTTRHILFGTNRHESRRIWISLQVHRFPGNGETTFHLGANGDIFYILSQGIG